MADIKSDYKFILNILSLAVAVVYGYYEMDSRIKVLESKIEQNDIMSKLRDEIQELKTGGEK
tara:strand:- start:583 stop:768 length:186 start_codon:yes stop_codon:yes gene_type:complete